jgi:hypothetical protein
MNKSILVIIILLLFSDILSDSIAIAQSIRQKKGWYLAALGTSLKIRHIYSREVFPIYFGSHSPVVAAGQCGLVSLQTCAAYFEDDELGTNTKDFFENIYFKAGGRQ